jgi:glycosyltransferase involved in cell wall biosynthesis
VRILHISSALTYGGGERHLTDLCRELAARGHEIFVALRPTNQWKDQLDLIPQERILNVSIRNSFGMFSARRIARFVERHDIEIIHAHVARDYLAASAAARLARVRLVLTRHVMFSLKPFHRFALRNVDAAIAVSPPVVEQLKRTFSAQKIHLIPNGISMDYAALSTTDFRAEHGIPSDVPLIVTLGELKPLKGQRDLVLAANEVVKTHPEAYFVIAGKDNTVDKRFRRELRRLVRVLGMEGQFLFLDWLDDIRPLLKAADLFVSPSHSESFGLAILEAMAAGVPVIATATGGAKELISEATALVPVKDPLKLGEVINWYLDHPHERDELGRICRSSAHQRYGLERMVNETEDLYRQVLDGR